MKYLLILNDPAYGTERSYNGLRLAIGLTATDTNQVRVFLIGDAVKVALAAGLLPAAWWLTGRTSTE